jgi:thiol-disulfide isomerase/thioredoxin
VSTTRTAPPSRAVGFLVGGIVLVCLLALVAVIATSSSGDDAADQAEEAGLEQQQPVNVGGSFLPVLAGGEDPAVGTTIPTIEGRTFAGDPVTIAPDGTPKLIVFLAHWCPHCQAEVPRLVEQLGGRDVIDGVQVVGVATSTDETAPNFPPSAWLADEAWPAPTLADDVGNQAAQAMGLSGFPYFVAVDADGRVVARASGELQPEAVEALVAAAGGSAV